MKDNNPDEMRTGNLPSHQMERPFSQSLTKSLGETPTERLLATLCENTFLKIWSYPNPYKADGKELCDLIAVFDDHVFIFFDRESRALKNSTPQSLEVTWQRWKNTAIDKQIKTASGAVRYLQSNNPIFLDRKCSVPFPIPFDPSECQFHKFIVAHGAADACKTAAPENVYGSLAVSYGDPQHETINLPFFLDLDKDNIVHVFDEHNLPIIFSALDTVTDFLDYICEKERAIRELDGLSYCGEEDLVAHYLLNYNRKENIHQIGHSTRKFNLISIGEGEWRNFIQSDSFEKKREADSISYLWDNIIQRACDDALTGSLLGETFLYDTNSAIHEMAREPRLSRRAKAQNIVTKIRAFPDDNTKMSRHVSVMLSEKEKKAYVFLQVHVPNSYVGDEQEKRELRRAFLDVACGYLRNKINYLENIVGIAIFAPKHSEGNSEDFLLLECKTWTGEQREHYELVGTEGGFYRNGIAGLQESRIYNFPDDPRSQRRKKIGRNEKCPCGSGKKYKKCCGP